MRLGKSSKTPRLGGKVNQWVYMQARCSGSIKEEYVLDYGKSE